MSRQHPWGPWGWDPANAAHPPTDDQQAKQRDAERGGRGGLQRFVQPVDRAIGRADIRTAPSTLTVRSRDQLLAELNRLGMKITPADAVGLTDANLADALDRLQEGLREARRQQGSVNVEDYLLD